MNNQLPPLSSIFLPAMFTLRKNKNIAETGIQFAETFKEVYIEKQHLETFKSYFGFRSVVPLTYLYTIVQRAQAALMLDKRFTLPIPGMVHIENLLTKARDIDPDADFDIVSSTSIPYKASGSFKGDFIVELSQNGRLVARCESVYLIKRKSKKAGGKKRKIEPLPQVDHQTEWEVSPRIGKEYAQISGDKNPIHVSRVFAKLMGFKKPIMHGWYSICKIEQFMEAQFGVAISEISVNFSSPVFLPSQTTFDLSKSSSQEFAYQLVNSSDNKILLNGVMKCLPANRI